MLKVIDLERIAAITRAKKVLAACDNTFASPWTQRPLEYGFDLVINFTTKYLNGHSDMVGGIVIVGENAEVRERMAFLQNAVGAVLGPLELPFWPCGGSKRSRCAWSGNRPRRCASRIGLRSIRGSSGCIFQALSLTHSMSWRAGKCAHSAR